MDAIHLQEKAFHAPPSRKILSEDLDWWSMTITTGRALRPITTPLVYIDIAAYSDASSSIGIGVVIGDKWRAWCLLPKWQTNGGKQDITWAEAIGLKFLIVAVARTLNFPHHIVVYGDNTSVIDSWKTSRHRNREVNEVFKRIHARIAAPSFPICSIINHYVTSGNNPADNPSRGVYGDPKLLIPPIPIPQQLDHLVVDFTEPLHP